MGLIRATTTQFAIIFYAMHIALRIWNPLLATVHGAPWNEPNKNPLKVKYAQDILNPIFFKQVYYFICCIYPGLISS